jgi:hypothetical protein
VAFGFPAYHQEDVTLAYPITHELIAFACQQCGFTPPAYQPAPGSGIWRTSRSMSLWSWGEVLAITWLGPTLVRIRSECAFPTQCIDWGRNASNVHALASALLAATTAR